MLPLKISFGGFVSGAITVILLAVIFYCIGKKKPKENKMTPPKKPESPEDKYIQKNPSTPKAKKAFLENIQQFLPYFTGITDIKVDKNKLTEAIISVNDSDLTALWNQTMNEPEKWFNLIASFGLAPDNRTEFVAMDKHSEMYSLIDGSPLENGVRYTVLSACWILTETVDDKVVKRVVKKGIVDRATNAE